MTEPRFKPRCVMLKPLLLTPGHVAGVYETEGSWARFERGGKVKARWPCQESRAGGQAEETGDLSQV